MERSTNVDNIRIGTFTKLEKVEMRGMKRSEENQSTSANAA